MSMIWANEGADQAAGVVVGKFPYVWAVTLRLRSNSNTPANTDSFVGAQNTEVTATGYGSIGLTGGSWLVSPTYPTTGLGQYYYPQQTFVFTGVTTQTVYGYFLTAVINGTTYLWGSELFGTSYTIPALGGSLLVTPTVQVGQR